MGNVEKNKRYAHLDQLSTQKNKEYGNDGSRCCGNKQSTKEMTIFCLRGVDNIECIISGDISIDEIKMMIDSIEVRS